MACQSGRVASAQFGFGLPDRSSVDLFGKPKFGEFSLCACADLFVGITNVADVQDGFHTANDTTDLNEAGPCAVDDEFGRAIHCDSGQPAVPHDYSP